MSAGTGPLGPVRLLIVDDHAVVRHGLRTFLELQDTIAIVGEAGDGIEALQRVLDLAPDVVLMDLEMPRREGTEAIGDILAARPATRIVVLTSFGDDARVLRAVRAGATSYLLKDAPPPAIAEAVVAARRGESIVAPSIAGKLMRELAADRLTPRPEESLTARELEVLREIAHGRSNQQIADALGIGIKTVKTHVSAILAKLAVQDRTQAALYAVQRRLDRE